MCIRDSRYPDIRYLFGAVSISNNYPASAKERLVNFYQQYFPAQFIWALAKTPFASDSVIRRVDAGYQQAFTQLKSDLARDNLSVPTLYKQYSELCEDNGVQFVAFNIDADFADCIDGLVLVDIQHMKAAKKQRYLGAQHL